MDAILSQRPRLHCSTWLLLLIPATVLALANVPGEYRLHWHTGKPMGCEHGWPCAWLVRQRLDGRDEDLWALTHDVGYLNAAGLSVDVLTAAAILACFAATVEWRRRRRHRACQFTLADWMVGVVVLGCVFADITLRRDRLAQLCPPDGELSYADLEIDAPTWLRDLLPDDEKVYLLAWWLGRYTFSDADGDLPADAAEEAILSPLLDLEPEQVRVKVCSHSPSRDDGPPRTFDPSALRSLRKLRHLTLERTDDEVLDCLESLTELRSLEFDEECQPLSEEAAGRLKGLTKLRFLSGTRACLGDAGIAAIAGLKTLEGLSTSGAFDADLARFKALKRLRFLALREGGVTDAGLAHLAACTQLEELDVSGCRITGTGLAALTPLRCQPDGESKGCRVKPSSRAAALALSSKATARKSGGRGSLNARNTYSRWG
jgi:hypothetical protein